MVNDRTPPEPLDHKVVVGNASIVLERHFHDALLDQDQLVGQLILLADEGALLVCDALEPVDNLLLCMELQ